MPYRNSLRYFPKDLNQITISCKYFRILPEKIVKNPEQPAKRVYKRVDYTAQEAVEQTETEQAKADQTATAQTADPEVPNNAETGAKADDAGEQD